MACDEMKDYDGIVQNILKTLGPTYKKITHMIEQVIPCIEKFTIETHLGRLELDEIRLRQSGYFPIVNTSFNMLNV